MRKEIVALSRRFYGLLLPVAWYLIIFGAFPVFGQDTLKVSQVNENYRIGPGDVIDVIVSQNQTLSRPGVRVNNRGMIQLAMLETDVPAACLTERELADQIKEKYKKFILNPYINVAVKEFNSSPVALIGAVNSPGRFQLQRPVRLLELLTFVNGPNANAGKSIEIVRNLNRPYCEGPTLVLPGDGSEELLSLALADTMKGVEPANPFVKPGDIIRVVDADQLQAYIGGNVRSTLTINLKEPVTLSQAIAMAGGLVPGAQSEKIIIRRQVPGSLNREPITVNLKEINQQKKDDILLQPNDLVEVPGPRPTVWSFFKTLLPAVTRLPIGVIP